MTHGVELAGVVQDDLGAPQPFVLVRVEQTLGERLDDDELEGFATRTRTDGDGAFRIGGLPPRGAFALSVWSRAEQLIACETIEMPAAAQRRVWTVPKGTSIDGRVIDESGEPLQNAFVRASLAQIDCYRTARTRRDGRFRIDGAVPGRWNLGVEYGESSRLAIANEPVRRLALVALDVPPDGARDVEVRLSSASDMWRLRSVRVRFFDARNGSEVDDVEWIQWAGIDSTFERGVPGSRLRGDGLRVALAVGSYDVGVRSIGYAPKAMRIEVLDGDGVQDVVVDLEPED
jgi:hypothetical protein